MPMLSEFM